jgi:hypothetical protein
VGNDVVEQRGEIGGGEGYAGLQQDSEERAECGMVFPATLPWRRGLLQDHMPGRPDRRDALGR